MFELQTRIVRSAVVQEGEKPPEDPAQLLAELDRLHAETLALVQRIDRTNSATPFAEGATLSDVIAERELLKLLRQRIVAAADATTEQQGRYLNRRSGSSARWTPAHYANARTRLHATRASSTSRSKR